LRAAAQDGIVSAQETELRILAVVPHSRRGEISRQLAALNAHILFVARSAEAFTVIREDAVFQVALLPATLSDTDWWELWGVLALLNPRPALLVYTRKATFQLWSGVLEMGGYDVIVEPFSDGELQDAVLRAAKSFEERPPNGSLQE
jgi:PleD family two-component response regulator